MEIIYVTKMNGGREPYNEEKIIRSMKNSGADIKVINEILPRINKILYDGIPTKKIFKFVFRKLAKIEKTSGIRYNLKQGIMDLGVNGGYAFEKFVAKVLEKKGYKIKLNQKIMGKFIEHEIDVDARKDNEKIMVEAKHFSKPWLGMQIQTALYVYARFLDVKKTFNKAMLATNTKFSPQVVAYSEGVGIKLMGWRYPKEESLEETIKKYKIYPITMLPLKKWEIKKYLEEGVITFEDLLNEKSLGEELKKEMKKILNS